MIHVGVGAWNLPGDRRGIGRYLRCILDASGQFDAADAEHLRVAPSALVTEPR